MKKYKHIVSLGHFCSPAMEFEKISRRQFSLPFDWLITPKLKVVLELINSNFKDFLNEEYMFQLKDYPSYYRNVKFHIDFYHDFSPFKSFKKQIDDVREKYNRRIKRFYKTIAQPTLFLRYIGQKDISYISENFEAILEDLKQFNPQNNLIFVANKETMGINVPPPHIYFVDKDLNDDVSRSFLNANNELRQYILENVEESTPKPKKKKNQFIILLKKLYKKTRLKLKIVYRHNKQC